MNFKDFFIHIVITVISILICYPYEFITVNFFETIYGILHLLIIFFLYFLSGFITTKGTDKFDVLNYLTIVVVGIILLITAIVISPSNTDWKHNNDAMIWFIYQIYVSGISTPFNAISNFSFTPNINLTIFILGIFTVIPSIFQSLGGYYKINNNYTIKK